MEVSDEKYAFEKELKWLLEEQVHKDLTQIHATILECSRRFPFRMGFGDQTVVKSQRNLLSSPNNTGQIKCVVTLTGDSICDADISFKHKAGKDHHIFKTKIQPDKLSWRLHQVQDSANHLARTLSIISSQDPDHVYKSAREVILLLEELLKFLTQGRTCLAFPKRKSIEELIRNHNMQSFIPPVPNDVALSFYIHSSKLILTVYHLQIAAQQVEITSRHQMEGHWACDTCGARYSTKTNLQRHMEKHSTVSQKCHCGAVFTYKECLQRHMQAVHMGGFKCNYCPAVFQSQSARSNHGRRHGHQAIRNQPLKVECTVQWLNEAVILFTLAIQQTQQLLDKLKVLEEQKVS